MHKYNPFSDPEYQSQCYFLRHDWLKPLFCPFLSTDFFKRKNKCCMVPFISFKNFFNVDIRFVIYMCNTIIAWLNRFRENILVGMFAEMLSFLLHEECCCEQLEKLNGTNIQFPPSLDRLFWIVLQRTVIIYYALYVNRVLKKQYYFSSFC